MAYRISNRHSVRFVFRKILRRLRDNIDVLIESQFSDRSRTAF
jgi:hypothetical protein